MLWPNGLRCVRSKEPTTTFLGARHAWGRAALQPRQRAVDMRRLIRVARMECGAIEICVDHCSILAAGKMDPGSTGVPSITTAFNVESCVTFSLTGLAEIRLPAAFLKFFGRRPSQRAIPD